MKIKVLLSLLLLGLAQSQIVFCAHAEGFDAALEQAILKSMMTESLRVSTEMADFQTSDAAEHKDWFQADDAELQAALEASLEDMELQTALEASRIEHALQKTKEQAKLTESLTKPQRQKPPVVAQKQHKKAAAATKDASVESRLATSLLEESEIIHPSDLPDLGNIDLKVLYLLIKSATNTFYKNMHERYKPTFTEKDVLQHLLASDHYHALKQHQQPNYANALVRLVAFVIAQVGPEFNEHYADKSKPHLSWCRCTSPEQRITWTIALLLTVKTCVLTCSLERPFVYTSVASGMLLQDYSVLAGLIKMGVPAIHVHCIDPNYEVTAESITDTQKKFDAAKAVHVHYSEKVENFEIQKDPLKELAWAKTLDEKFTKDAIELFRDNLVNLFMTLQKDDASSNFADMLDMTFWNDASEYKNRLEHYRKRHSKAAYNSLFSDCVALVDPSKAGDNLHARLHAIFQDVLKTCTKPDFTSAVLDPTIIITRGDSMILNFTFPGLRL